MNTAEEMERQQKGGMYLPEGTLTDTNRHEEETELVDHYRNYTKQQLVEEYEKLARSADQLALRSRTAAMEEIFNQIIQEEKSQAEHALDTEDDEITVKSKPDTLAERFYTARSLIRKKRQEQVQQLEKQKEENLAIKKQLIERLRHILQHEENLQQAFRAYHEIQEKWRSIGPVPFHEAKDLNLSYRTLCNRFFNECIKIRRELQELDWKKNLETRIRLCEEAEALLNEPSLRATLDRLAMIEVQWREVGPVHRDQQAAIMERFKKAVQAIEERKKEYYRKLKEQWEENARIKTSLCEEVEKIQIPENATLSQWKQITELLNTIWERWRNTGRAEKNENEELWKRFQMALQAVYQKRKAFFQQRRKEIQANLQKKETLCQQAEALIQLNDWKAAMAGWRKLNEEWKQIGFVPGKAGELIRERFRQAYQAITELRKKQQQEAEKELLENLEKKNALIAQMESFIPVGNREEDLKTLKNFQTEWSSIGMVPLAMRDEVYKRYRQAIDKIFEKLQISEQQREAILFKERIEHLKTLPEGLAKMREEQRVINHKITQLSNELLILENNLGFFARSKNAENIKRNFEEKIIHARNEINRLRQQLEIIRGAK
jgi:hypothetical protein